MSTRELNSVAEINLVIVWKVLCQRVTFFLHLCFQSAPWMRSC